MASGRTSTRSMLNAPLERARNGPGAPRRDAYATPSRVSIYTAQPVAPVEARICGVGGRPALVPAAAMVKTTASHDIKKPHVAPAAPLSIQQSRTHRLWRGAPEEAGVQLLPHGPQRALGPHARAQRGRQLVVRALAAVARGRGAVDALKRCGEAVARAGLDDVLPLVGVGGGARRCEGQQLQETGGRAGAKALRLVMDGEPGRGPGGAFAHYGAVASRGPSASRAWPHAAHLAAIHKRLFPQDVLVGGADAARHILRCSASGMGG